MALKLYMLPESACNNDIKAFYSLTDPNMVVTQQQLKNIFLRTMPWMTSVRGSITKNQKLSKREV